MDAAGKLLSHPIKNQNTLVTGTPIPAAGMEYSTRYQAVLCVVYIYIYIYILPGVAWSAEETGPPAVMMIKSKYVLSDWVAASAGQPAEWLVGFYTV